MCSASMEKLVVTLLFSVSLVVGLSFAPEYIEKSISGVQCLEGQFLCADGLKCIPRSWKCDYSPDCSDASDEPADCPEAPCGTFRCNVTGKCLPQGWMCDGEADCGAGDTSDEDNTICKKGNTCPLNYFRCKNDINCILIKHLCDGSTDCPDRSDEGNFCNDTGQCQSLGCKYGCKPTDKGPQCFCPEGQQPNGTACIDSDECEVEGSCDQLCTNLKDSYTCGCSEGYELISRSNCKAINSPPDEPATLLYASNSGLARLHLNGTAVPGNTRLSSQYAVTLDFDHRNNSVCWVSSNTSWSVFRCASADNFNDAWVIPQPTQNGLNYVHDIARDWLTGNWYILDRREMIFMCNATMSVCITLMDVVLNEPRGIALDPSTGYMFFSNWGTTEPKLERTLMDGTQRHPIVHTKIVYPFGVTLDYPNQHVYWVDGYLSHVERVDYNGDNRRIIIKLKMDERPYGISLFENSLFVTSWKDDSIKQINRFNRHNVSTFHTNLTEPMHVHVFHRQRQPDVNHPCGVYNGGCQHICIPLWTDGQAVASCHCQPGHVLGPGGSCVARELQAFLIYAKGRPGMIKGVALDEVGSSEVMVPITSLTRPTTLDYDVRTQFIYYADIQRFVIERQSLDGTKKEPVINSALLNVEGLAVDWMGRNIYWTDEGVSSIFVCSMKNPDKRKMLLHGNLTNARAIVLNPAEGYMYWTVWQFTYGDVMAGGDGLIERAWMDGTQREPFVKRDLQWPNGLTIDFMERHLYWCDGFHNKIERIGLDGKNREVMLAGDVLNHPYGLAYYNSFIYWSEFQNGTIKRVSLDNRDSPEELRVENPYIFDLKIFSNSSQTDTNKCTSGSLQCADLCLSLPTGPVCACATGYEPDVQHNYLCNPITNFTQPSLCSEGQFQCKKNLRCIDERYLCDGDNDCLDNSDEDTSSGGICEAAQCHKDMFQCGNNQCIDAHWVCDRDRDCEDGSDESPDECNQPLCPADKFRCTESRRCIAQAWVCDIDKDCGPGDDSDEHASCEYEECGVDDFKCGNKRCVPMFYVCDGDDDCRDGTDEKFCDTFCANATNLGPPISSVCSKVCLNITEQEKCQEIQGCTYCGSNNTCIAVSQLCDGVLDCPNGSDETRCEDKILQGCNRDEYMCVRTRECIPQSLKCDGSDDCLDRSDELGCESIDCSHSEWKCDTGDQCIPDMWKCDGEEDCNDGSDEKLCPSTPVKCPSPGHICDNDTLCIQPEHLCDGKKNCKDGSDEGGRCGSFDCQLMDCDKSCTQGPGGPVCTCPIGQTLLPDGRMCSDLHPCQQWGTCSQECIPTKHSHKCACIKGYALEPDGFTCKSTDSAVPYLIFSNRHELHSITLKDGNVVKALISSLKNTIALDFYHADDGDVIFWTDVVDDKIYRGTLLAGALSNIEVVVQTGLATAEGLAVDWLAENLYWVESNLNQIEVAKLNGSYRRTLIASQMENPRAISLDPRVGMIFWTDWEEGKARIESCSMSGEGRRVAVMVSEISGSGWPNGLTLDYALRRIYWIDAKSDSIHTSLYDGSDQREILREHDLLSHPFAISLFGNNVYWTDWTTNSVISANKFNGSDIHDIQRTITQPFDIQVLHPSRQPRDVPNPCKEDNGGCSHLCLLSFNSTHQCNCPHIMSLGPDNKTCIRNEKVLLFSRPNEIRGVDLNKPTHDIIPRISVPKVQHAAQLDFEAKSKKIYWADSVMNEVRRASLTGAPIETVIDTALQSPRGFAVDWLSKNLFVTSNGGKSRQINVATLNGEFLNPVVTENILDPLSLAVDPYGGRIFWSDIGGSFHTVHMASMAGSNVTLLSSQRHNEHLDHPRSLTFDASSQRLYWVNVGSDSIQYYDLAREKTVNLLISENITKPEALTVYMDYVYYTDASVSNIFKMDKTSGDKRELVRSGLGNFLSLKIYDESVQDGSSACSHDSPPCAHLCLPKNRVERECRCALGYEVYEKDPTTCVGIDGVLIYSNNVGLSGFSVYTPFTESGTNLELLTPISEIGMAISLDFHARQDLLVWADGDQGTITSIQRDGTNRHIIVEGAEAVQGIAVDWVANNLYWTNPQSDVIEMCRLNGSDHFVVIAHDLEKPGAIAVHPGSGYMFWADTGDKVRIERASLDGANRTILVNTSLQFPADLFVDFEEGHLYWVDQRAKTLERVNLDGTERTVILDSSVLHLPIATFIFNNNIYWADMVYGGGSVRSTSKTDLNRTSTLRSGLGDTVRDLVIMSNDVQIGFNPCANNNGGCAEICLFTGTHVQCQCYHARVAKDGKSCEDYDAFLMFSSITSIDSIHMFDEKNPNAPLKKITSDFMKNAISLTFDYASKRLYYSDIQRGSINTVHFNGSNHAILVEGQGSVEGLAFEEKERDLYWTCESDATINRMSVDPSRTQRVEKIVHLEPADRPRGIVVDSCDLQIYWTNWNPEAPSIQRSLVSGIRVESIVTTLIQMPNGLAIDHKAQKLYWGDARLDKIERCNLDGSDRIILLKNVPSHPFDLAIYGDYLFWTDWVLHAVVRANKYTTEDVVKLRNGVTRLMGIVAVANDTNDCDGSPCRVLNGGCEDICTIDERAQVICHCSPGRMLLADGRRCAVRVANCSSDQFECSTGFCIPYIYSCDGVAECPDGSDEDQKYCVSRTCNEGYFACGNGPCVPQEAVCDRHPNCLNYRDENNCECKDDEIQCETSGLCIAAYLRCDKDPDCPDASDEMDCEKPDCTSVVWDGFNSSELINCANTTNCIHPKWICDGANDCWDNSDEQNCTTINVPVESSSCPSGTHQCRNGRCIADVFICDGDNDCKDGNTTSPPSDEASCNYTCSGDQFTCTDGSCIPNMWHCDAHEDCVDGSDEPDDCDTKICKEGEFKCNTTGRCIPQKWVCDGDNDCGEEGTDENPPDGCPIPVGFTCPPGQFICPLFSQYEHRCLPLEYYCDGLKDCWDGRDEPDSCPPRVCLDSQFRCNSGKCIPSVWVCNGRNDCSDLSDEANCTTNVITEGYAGCPEEKFKCKNDICVDQENLCDGHDDCGDHSDEELCHINECKQSHPPVCAQKCIDKPVGYDCECNEGFTVNSNDSKLCQDIDECSDFPCPHHCHNTYGAYKCSCASGYISEQDGHKCRANSTVKPKLIFTNRYYIREVNIDGTNSRLLVTNLTNAVGLDYDIVENCIYWSDVTHLSSSVKKMCNNSQPVVLHSAVQSPDGIALDWVGRNLYWCDKGKDTIEVSKLNGDYRKVLINKGLQDPRAVVLDPFQGNMYWTDWGNQPHIGKAGMDGSEQRIIVNSSVAWPNALTISYVTHELFWADAHQDYIAQSDLEGKNIRIIMDRDRAPKHMQHIFAITVFEDYLYWTDWELKSVLRAEKYSGKDVRKIYDAEQRPMDIHVYHPFRQLPLENNPCEDNGGCKTMCLLAPGGGKTCTCPDNFVLSDDGVSCESDCLSSMFVCVSTYKCIPFWWECDTQDDCGDNADERETCRPYKCTPGQFQCENGNCIHPSLICDNQDHCKDSSDEQDCNKYACVLSQFKCPATNESHAFCIAGNRRCDGTPDCNGGVDEIDCPAPSCLADWFSCNNTQCIPKVWVCDGDPDCSDGSDEMPECSTRQCPQENFRCNNGRCIPRSWKCDGEFDCPDKEDEGDACYRTHFCDVSQFKCDNNKCIHARWKCDGENDCLDGSDENGCPERNCSESEFRCDDGRCILSKYKCDGTPNCADSSDETNCDVRCTEGQFKCETSPHCILSHWVCDEDPDCIDASDERNCSLTCGPEYYRCHNGACVFDAWVCDGEDDCTDGSDESKELCADHSCAIGRFRCKNNMCVMESHVCDGEDQCGDGSDEASELCQRKKICGLGQFQCKNGECIGKKSVCDGFDDCTDYSDEQNCPSGCRFGECSQICNVKKDGNHTCTCAPGYSLHSYSQKNQKSCFADGNLAYMVLANDNHLRKLSPYKHGNSASILTLTEEDSKTVRVHSMDVLYGEHPRAFWTNLHDNTLVSMPVPATHEQDTSRTRRDTSPVTIVLGDLKKPRGVAVDWVTGIVYVVNAGDRTILAVSLDGSKKVTLISTDLEQTHDIVVDPQSGQLFWTDWGFSPGIDVACMDGQNQKRLVYRDVQGPVGLAIDYPTRRLYWADIKTNKIETVKLDGSDRHLVKHFLPGEGIPSNLDVFEDLVYLITQDTNTVYRMSKFGYRSQEMVRISQHPIKISDLLIVQEQKQDKSLFNPCLSNPCDPDAMCLISGPKNYSCICPDGMTKDIVAGEMKCLEQPSRENACPLFCNKGDCVQTPSGPRCICHPKYHGQICDKYRCSGYCRNNGHCSIQLKSENITGVPSMRCFCGPKWTGERCETPVKTCDNFCQNGGECKTDDKVPYCICPIMFTGERCQHCEDLHCENGGTCRTRLINGETVSFCSCAEGYHGVTCSHSVCADYCKHGTCRILQGRPQCACSSGWSGSSCGTCIDKTACEDLCADFICENEGKCIIFPGPPRNASCSCAPGYHGQHCEISICDNYCNNGLCKIRMGTPICECDRGWSGPRCDEHTCPEGGANCGCPQGYHGLYCNNSVCTNYCQRGECQLDEGDPFCKCPLGFSGDRCQDNDCDHKCHRGTCRITADGAVCDCEEGYTGLHCKEPLPSSAACLHNDCENGGTCYIVNDKRMCRCPQEYRGAKCEKPVAAEDNPCNLNCLHGGTCQMWFGSPACECTQGWAGMNCGLQTICEESSCFNGGVCKPNADPSLPPTCICPEGYTGYRCETPEKFRADKVETSSPNTATVIIGVFIAVVVLVVVIVVVWLWQRRRGKDISHVRLEENGETVEMTNPMYLHASDDQEDDPNPVFTLHDSPNTFKNPVYDTLYSEEAAASINQEEKTGLLQSDPLGALDTSQPIGSKS